jgi:hypothetical protein
MIFLFWKNTAFTPEIFVMFVKTSLTIVICVVIFGHVSLVEHCSCVTITGGLQVTAEIMETLEEMRDAKYIESRYFHTGVVHELIKQLCKKRLGRPLS